MVISGSVQLMPEFNYTRTKQATLFILIWIPIQMKICLYIPCVKITRNTLWVGTLNAGMYGMSYHGLGNAKVVNYRYNPEDKQSLSCNSVSDIIQPQVVDTNALWIGTDAGLNRFDLIKKSFSHFFRTDGLSSDHILRILEDDHGNIWCATTNGISVYDIRTGKIKSYGKGDGMPFTDFSNLGPNAAKGPDGQLFFSGVSGALSFLP